MPLLQPLQILRVPCILTVTNTQMSYLAATQLGKSIAVIHCHFIRYLRSSGDHLHNWLAIALDQAKHVPQNTKLEKIKAITLYDTAFKVRPLILCHAY